MIDESIWKKIYKDLEEQQRTLEERANLYGDRLDKLRWDSNGLLVEGFGALDDVPMDSNGLRRPEWLTEKERGKRMRG